MRTVWDILYLRSPVLNYVCPPICDVIFSGSSSPIIVLSQPALNQVTGLVLGGVGSFQLSWSVFPGAICYNVYFIGGDSVAVLLAQCISSPSFLLPEGLGDGTIVVTAITLEGETPPSEPVAYPSGSPSEVSVVASCPQTGRNGFPGVFTISRDAVRPTSLDVDFVLGGTAVNGVDYDMVPLVATIPAGTLSVDVEIDPIELAFSTAQTVTLTVSPSPDYVVVSPDSDTVTIQPPLVRIKDYGTLQPLMVPAPAGNELSPVEPSDGCEWDGNFNYVETFPPAPGPEFIYYFRDSAGNFDNGLVESLQGTKLRRARISGPTFGGGFWLWQVEILGYLADTNWYIVWRGTKFTVALTGPDGIYNLSAPFQATDLRPTLELELA